MKSSKLKMVAVRFVKSKAVLMAGLFLFLVVMMLFRVPLEHVLDRLRLIEFHEFRVYFGK